MQNSSSFSNKDDDEEDKEDKEKIKELSGYYYIDLINKILKLNID